MPARGLATTQIVSRCVSCDISVGPRARYSGHCHGGLSGAAVVNAGGDRYEFVSTMPVSSFPAPVALRRRRFLSFALKSAENPGAQGWPRVTRAERLCELADCLYSRDAHRERCVQCPSLLGLAATDTSALNVKFVRVSPQYTDGV